jgi:protein-S-isoprenylcysteine O-methyltransferase Ste14
MWRFVFIAFLIAHGGVHAAIWATPPKPGAPFDASSSWLLGSQRSLAMAVALVATVLLVVAGVGLSMHAEWWRPIAIAGLGVSFGLMVLWFSPWYSFIEVVNAALLIGLAFLSWPSADVLGA